MINKVSRYWTSIVQMGVQVIGMSWSFQNKRMVSVSESSTNSRKPVTAQAPYVYGLPGFCLSEWI